MKGENKMAIIVKVTKKDRTSFGRYIVPENEYRALVKYLTKKTTDELLFDTRKTILEPDDFRPWAYRY
jgi:hypothetical protein